MWIIYLYHAHFDAHEYQSYPLLMIGLWLVAEAVEMESWSERRTPSTLLIYYQKRFISRPDRLQQLIQNENVTAPLAFATILVLNTRHLLCVEQKQKKMNKNNPSNDSNQIIANVLRLFKQRTYIEFPAHKANRLSGLFRFRTPKRRKCPVFLRFEQTRRWWWRRRRRKRKRKKSLRNISLCGNGDDGLGLGVERFAAIEWQTLILGRERNLRHSLNVIYCVGVTARRRLKEKTARYCNIQFHLSFCHLFGEIYFNECERCHCVYVARRTYRWINYVLFRAHTYTNHWQS